MAAGKTTTLAPHVIEPRLKEALHAAAGSSTVSSPKRGGSEGSVPLRAEWYREPKLRALHRGQKPI